MESAVASRAGESGAEHSSDGRSAASWGAILAGTFVATSVSLILLALGAGLGFAAMGPWQEHGVTATTFAGSAAIWLIVMQWVSACFGGYIAGRLRTRWIGTHTHEVFFRDTAHGLVTWALATVVTAAVLAGTVSSLLGGGMHSAGINAASSAEGLASPGTSPAASYNVDKLFRTSAPSASGTMDYRGEAARIIGNAVASGSLAPPDRSYLATLIAQKTGVSQDDAQKRVDDAAASAMDTEAKVQAAQDKVRRASAEASIYTALSMLIGAFIACVSAALGGRLRDEHP